MIHAIPLPIHGAVLAIAACALFTRPARAGDGAAEEGVPALVARLGDEAYTEREAAHAKLLEIGEPARALLTEALGHADAEIRVRAEWILQALDIRKLRTLTDWSEEAHRKMLGLLDAFPPTDAPDDAQLRPIREGAAALGPASVLPLLEAVENDRFPHIVREFARELLLGRRESSSLEAFAFLLNRRLVSRELRKDLAGALRGSKAPAVVEALRAGLLGKKAGPEEIRASMTALRDIEGAGALPDLFRVAGDEGLRPHFEVEVAKKGFGLRPDAVDRVLVDNRKLAVTLIGEVASTEDAIRGLEALLERSPQLKSRVEEAVRAIRERIGKR